MEGPHSISVSRLCVCSLQKGKLHLEARFGFSYSKIIWDIACICLGFALCLHYPLAGRLLHKANGEVSSQCAATPVLSSTVWTWPCASVEGGRAVSVARLISKSGEGQGKPFSADLYKAGWP